MKERRPFKEVSVGSTNSRIVSMDQFRGYTVAGMILVNFIGDFTRIHPVFKHNNTYFSYADSIMPAFHFAVGFAFRLTFLRRFERMGPGPTYWHFIRRNLGLILLSLVLAPLDPHQLKTWAEISGDSVWGIVSGFLKCEFWETLAIIGVTSLFVLPVIGARAGTRVVFLFACATLHIVLSRSFYFDFMWARPNWLDHYWGATDVRGLDGGPLGFLAWAVPQLVGSLAYDLVARSPDRTRGRRTAHGVCLLLWAVVLMGLGYAMSCLGTTSSAGDIGGFTLAEPPFIAPSPERSLSYWMMSKRMCSMPFMFFATGFAMGVYALFVLLCDRGSLRVGVFQTFGRNPLAAYILHEMVGRAVRPFAPPDSPIVWIAATFLVYFGVTYLFVRHLEEHEIYLRM
jgi:predicted acyltransferase